MPEGAEGVELAWTSSDDKIATVDKDGNVKAVAEGTATPVSYTHLLIRKNKLIHCLAQCSDRFPCICFC